MGSSKSVLVVLRSKFVGVLVREISILERSSVAIGGFSCVGGGVLFESPMQSFSRRRLILFRSECAGVDGLPLDGRLADAYESGGGSLSLAGREGG